MTLKTDKSEFLAAIASPLHTHAVCWKIDFPYGRDSLYGTSHEEDIPVTVTDSSLAAYRSGIDLTGTYRSYAGFSRSALRSPTDGSVANMEVEGPVAASGELIPGVTAADIESGIFDDAVVHLFYLDYTAPDDWQKTISYGRFGEFSRDDTGKYVSELRGLAQELQQPAGDTYEEKCIVRQFGDSRCGFNLAAVTRTGVVATVTNRKSFTVTITPGTNPSVADYFVGGELVFTSGDNSGFKLEPKVASVAAGVMTVELWEEAPADIAVSDTLTVAPGCDRTSDRCKFHSNFDRFQGYGLFMTTTKVLMRGTAGAQSAGGENNPTHPTFGGLAAP